jgi:hypothetical protein
MATMISNLKSLGAAAMVAATLGMATLGVAPVLAQGEPPTGFSLNVPGGDNQTMQAPQSGAPQSGAAQEGVGRYDPRTNDFIYCLEDHEIIRGLRDYGFERPRITRYLRGERVEATAYWGRYQYSMRIDRCTGVVDRVRLIRRSGFGLQFNFGN